MRVLLLVWALGATVLAALWMPRPAPAPRSPAGSEIPRLRLRIAELEEALGGAAALPPTGAEAPRLEDVIAAARSAAADPDATTGARQAADRALDALLARDADAHAVLARMLPCADEETADFLLAALVHNPFAKAARKKEVTDGILSIAASCLKAEQPHVRAAAATLLLGYAGPPEPPHVLLAMDALAAERDPVARDTILGAVAERARGVPLTEAETAPLVAELRSRAGAGETTWLSALADWSASDDDYANAQALFLEQTETRARQECLNAFRREARLVEGNVEDAEAFLRDAMLDLSLDDDARGLARFLLDGYAPWSTKTADAVRRFEEVTR